MGAKKGNKNALGNAGGGRPTKYNPVFAEMAYEIALLGATDCDLARIFDVNESTINQWKSKHFEFFQALKKGKDLADAKVAVSLYRRAVGYEHEAVKIFNNEGMVTTVPYTERYPPDTTAGIFWLKNRQKDKWRDKQEIEVKEKGTRLIRRDSDTGEIVIEMIDDDQASDQ